MSFARLSDLSQVGMTAEQLESEGHVLVSRGHALLAEAVKVRARDEGGTYGSRAPFSPPPGLTFRSFRDRGPDLVAAGFAERRGGLRGRSVLYVMTREQHRAWLASTGVVTAKPSSKAPAASSLDVLLQSAGYRATRPS